jgi:hypothetical protein
LKFDDYSEVKKEYQTNTDYLKKQLDTTVNKLRIIEGLSKLAGRSIVDIFHGFASLDIADKKHIINFIPPANVDYKTGDVFLKLNYTMAKILVPNLKSRMNNTINATTNFKDRKVSVKRAITILAKSNIEVNEDEAALILNFLYHIAATYNKYDSFKG